MTHCASTRMHGPSSASLGSFGQAVGTPAMGGLGGNVRPAWGRAGRIGDRAVLRRDFDQQYPRAIAGDISAGVDGEGRTP